MWEALMMLRLIVSVAPGLRVGRQASQPAAAPTSIEDAIRLNFAGYRLSLPIASSNVKNDDRKIA
ncbi:hypothetical protein EOA27_30925 [Mesorhizobium sp. M2A.F.Ca.ET.037.01.1.1]|uniref:hypothetical protein n=1 Tax=unclassified Mesorhizobium TaxID=325217 RepID=UPI000FCBCA6B|nr:MULTISPECIES: hypothetical protein [unclassified Mesorhizobium]RUX03544.1 hypothetical protein EOA27_30925 [Mesorhizobium sp. M2A.F.Ca.ET.037.01.1.1]RWA93762.1 MAG: hypothetical protein EOQ31_01305 [Mesorhizobium sp.]RWF15715.1 MAG: hypothetical protein EOS44_34095 [Mesorhizobium sp.]RWX65334.1 hypothetical protein EOA24_20960 [Mesorhizobium sp. M2A.F.Ca.ET.039.01.1.1]